MHYPMDDIGSSGCLDVVNNACADRKKGCLVILRVGTR
jgi:hypothetical protein